MKFLFYLLLLIFVFSCKAQITTNESKRESKVNLKEFSKAYFASGCFWCVELIFESINGVEEVHSGYCGGKEKNPTYEQVSAGETGHAESVELIYNPKIISYESLLKIFFASHDPSTLNRQGPDSGEQYRSVIFFQNENEKQLAKNYIIKLLNEKTHQKITTEIVAFEKFYIAEKYHQNFVKLNPSNPYVLRVSLPRYNHFKSNFKE